MGCVAPEAEAEVMLDAAERGSVRLEEMLARRRRGEPLEWIVGWAAFGPIRVEITPGVFVPRPASYVLVERVAGLAPAGGVVVDLCTGTGAIASAVSAARPDVRLLAGDLDPLAVGCARRNGVVAFAGDLFDAIPEEMRGAVDVVTAVAPYVPSDAIHLLARDAIDHEPRTAIDGGPGGTDVVRRIIGTSRDWLRPTGALILEIGGDQGERMRDAMRTHGFADVEVLTEDGRDHVIIGSVGGSSRTDRRRS
jgi:release factor glutamine methyltransferase